MAGASGGSAIDLETTHSRSSCFLLRFYVRPCVAPTLACRNTDWVLGLVVSTGTDTKINFGGSDRSEPKAGHAVQLINRDIMGYEEGGVKKGV